MRGETIKTILEDAGENLFNPDLITGRAATWCGLAV